MIIQIRILRKQGCYLDHVSTVVNQVTSPGKNVVLLQLLIHLFPFFSSQRNRKCFNYGGRGHSYKECASPCGRERGVNTEEAGEEEEGAS